MKIRSPWLPRALWLLTGTFTCQAVSAQVAPPNVPSLRPPVPARWSITYTEADATTKSNESNAVKAQAAAEAAINGGGKSHRLTKELYETAGKVAYVIKSFADGTTDPVYIVDRVAYTVNPGSKQVQPEPIGSFSSGNLRFADTYPGFEWLKKQYFVDEQPIGDHKYWHYRQSTSQPKSGGTQVDAEAALRYDASVAASEREAWIDEETGLPYAFRRGLVTGVYNHQTPSGDKIELPSSVAKAVRRFEGYTD